MSSNSGSSLHPFRSLGNPNFRILWIGVLLWSAGTWMQRIAVSWLVLTTTGSAFLVALSFGLYFLPNLLLGPFSGAVVDRVNRKRLLVAVQSLNVMASLVLMMIVISDVQQTWLVLLVALVFGIGMSFGIPTVQVLVYDLVGPRDARNGIALQSVVMRSVGAVGAVAGGILIETLGFSATFLAAACCYVLGLVTISLIRYRPIELPTKAESVVYKLIEGFRFFFSNRLLTIILAMAMMVEAFGYGAVSLLPVFAGEAVLGVGSGGLGVMNGALSIGAAFGAFYLGASTESMRMNIKLLVSFLFCGLFTVAYSQSGVFLVSVVLLAGFGLAEGMFTILVVLLLQQNVPSQMRGRVMGAWTFCIGVGPVGAMSIGYLAETIGVQYAVGISGALLVLATSIITVTVPRLRKE